MSVQHLISEFGISLTWTPAGATAMMPVSLDTQIDSPYEQDIDAGDPVTTPMTCSGTQNSGIGYIESYSYTVTSFFGNELPGVSVNESFGKRTNVYPGNSWPSPVSTSYTTGTTGHGDELWACSYGNVNPSTRVQDPVRPWCIRCSELGEVECRPSEAGSSRRPT